MKRPLQNTLAAVAADALSRLLGFAATAYIARTLGTSGFGLVSIGFAVLGYAALVASPGLQIMGTREVARTEDPPRDLVNNLTSLRVVLALGSVGLTALVTLPVFGLTPSWLMVILFAATALPLALSLDWFFQGAGRIVPVSVAKVLSYCVYVLLLIVLVSSPEDALWTPIAFWVGNAASALLLFLLFQKTVGGARWSGNLKRWKSLLTESIPLGASIVLTQTITNIPVLIAGALLSLQETGLFSASMKLLFFMLMIDRVFNTLFFPAISRYRQLEESQFNTLAAVGLKLMLTLTIPLAVLGVTFAPAITAIVYGSAFGESVSPLRWLFLYFILTTANTVLMSVLYADKRDKEVLKVLAWGTATLILFCILFSLLWRAEGTAIGLSIGEGLVTVLLLWKARTTVTFGPTRVLLPILISGAAMTATVALVNAASPILSGLLGLGIFVLGVILFGGMRAEDIRFLKQRFV